MSETRNKGAAIPSLDSVLADWPETEKPEAEWDERAESVMGRLRRGERGASAAYVSNDDLFSDPLGQSAEDGHNGSSPGASVTHPGAVTPRTRIREGIKMQNVDRERDRKSLQDLAKMAQGLTPPAPSSVAFGQSVPSSRSVSSLPGDTNKKDDSGIVDLAAASAADPHAAMRAQSTPLASQSLFEDNVPSSAHRPSMPPVSGPHMPAAYAYQQPAPSYPPPSYTHTPSAPPAAYASVHPIAPLGAQLNKKKSGGGIVFALGGLLAISAAAAGGFLYIRSHKAPAPAPVAVTQPAAVQPAVIADNAKPAEDVAPAKPADGATDLNSLPSVSSPGSSSKSSHVVASKGTHVKSAKPEGEEHVAAVTPAAKPAAKAEKVAASEPPPPSGPPGSLGEAMAQAVPAKEEVKPAAAAGGSASMGNVPQKPSQGAVTGAIGAVLPAARQCLGPDDPVSRASVVFNSDGSVYGVTVTGAAAGKPAEACIKDSLKKAKIQPFAESSYTANITIRHQ